MSPPPLAAIRGARVAQLIESDGPGGAERMVAELGRELTANGCEVVAFLPAKGEGWLGRELERSGVIVDSFRLERPLSAACARELAAAFRRHRIVLAHGHEFTMTVYGAWAARLAHVPHVSTMHGGRYYARRWRRRLALRLAVDFSGAVVAVSAELAAHLRRDLWLADGRVAVVPNGVRAHAEPCPTLREELAIAADAPILLAVGNLYDVKGHRHLVSALALLASHPHAHVVVAGRGELAPALEAHARAPRRRDGVRPALARRGNPARPARGHVRGAPHRGVAGGRGGTDALLRRGRAGAAG
jgi:glycosyltransferase involved in cell wall biosynthesis